MLWYVHKGTIADYRETHGLKSSQRSDPSSLPCGWRLAYVINSKIPAFYKLRSLHVLSLKINQSEQSSFRCLLSQPELCSLGGSYIFSSFFTLNLSEVTEEHLLSEFLPLLTVQPRQEYAFLTKRKLMMVKGGGVSEWNDGLSPTARAWLLN